MFQKTMAAAVLLTVAAGILIVTTRGANGAADKRSEQKRAQNAVATLKELSKYKNMADVPPSLRQEAARDVKWLLEIVKRDPQKFDTEFVNQVEQSKLKPSEKRILLDYVKKQGGFAAMGIAGLEELESALVPSRGYSPERLDDKECGKLRASAIMQITAHAYGAAIGTCWSLYWNC